MRSAMLRRMNVEAHGPLARVRATRSLKSRLPYTEVEFAAAELPRELLSERAVGIDDALSALEHFRERTNAVDVALWMLSTTRATRALHVSEPHSPAAKTPLNPIGAAAIVDRLRRRGALSCGAGHVSGVEELVPHGVQSFVVASGPSPSASIGALVVGWTSVEPPCDERAIAHLRVGAALLQRALVRGAGEQHGWADAIVGSLGDRIAVLDRNGTIVGVNAAWTAVAGNEACPFGGSNSPGTSYFEICQRAASTGYSGAAAVLEGVQAVARGTLPMFRGTYTCEAPGEEQCCVVVATPLPHPHGGAVIAHTVISHEDVLRMAERLGERRFQRFAHAIPLAAWVVTPDGRLRYGNERWLGIVKAGRDGAHGEEWTDAFHPHDRVRAADALRTAVAKREPFEVELRVHEPGGNYRWLACIAGPRFTADGRLQDYVGLCCDTNAKRETELALTELAAKVVSAQEEERRRIGSELHDDLGQQAALLAAKFDTLFCGPRRSAPQLRAGMADIRHNVQDLAVAIHNLSHQLHPARLRLLGLVNTLEALCRELSTQSGVHVRFTAHGVPPNVPESIVLCVFRVTQEALQNGLKHSGAREIDVALTGNGLHLTLRVSDNGRGFDPLTADAHGIGFLTMRERVELSGGTLHVESANPGGTTIEATLPLGPDEIR